MSGGYEKVGPTGLMNFQASALQSPMFYGSFSQTPYDHHPLLQSGPGQDADFQYMPAQSFEERKPSRADVRDFKTFSVPHSRAASTNSITYKSLKRKVSNIDEYDLPVQKRAAYAQVQVQDPNGDYYDLSGQTSPYSPFVPTPTGSTGIPACAGQIPSPRPSGHHYSTSTASQVSLTAPSPHTPAFSPSFTTVKSEQSPGAPLTPIPRPATSSPLKSSIPKLVRTSTMQASPEPFAGMPVPQTQNFNPYAMPLKANLKLRGDLDTMKEGWTSDEKEARRRLVEFKRSQTNSTITAEFGPVTPQERQPSSICISCIWWKERNEYFVTSVDTIYLLESLVGVRFTVEEKNRIRRNLEGFRPMTVSKAKPDSEEFFKIIMGFPHPKPRNIEKDVKVFPWKILSVALKKIISKYSASYSSTASSLLTPTSSVYSNGEIVDYHYAPSPHPEYMPASGSYPVHTEVSYVPGPQAMRMQGPPPVPELQLQMPEYVPGYDVNGQYVYQMVQAPQGTMAMPHGPMTAPITRMPSWDYAHFVNDSPITTAPQSAPPTGYPRGFIETAEFLPHMHYQQH
ncbi:hypothetical protein LTR99_005188 [Exophiala xenobiotica]|uniref:DUF7082 domain-containing protein n=1 Tax=Vermiconidia calcicola TaxID=1690605 RepID=A0AAV9Q8F3_9PEZI|nr:hypothetical protein LTR41_000375 [Exophiala xenobiotica]KAK5536054.1 hypothetical protein LTR25_005956 [Vermiconidia calcicola]KAK5541630.1 hypothetical protein LTR23_005719 [Chaetothyriales sp. CCFEE 6169]KAK5303426.1 hypothetical protein LTR99_005188 [Exophiala xenobiotica]KAK5359638.1 hypothetical protein LTS13_010529 [Exophiala xenobiotica]